MRPRSGTTTAARPSSSGSAGRAPPPPSGSSARTSSRDRIPRSWSRPGDGSRPARSAPTASSAAPCRPRSSSTASSWPNPSTAPEGDRSDNHGGPGDLGDVGPLRTRCSGESLPILDVPPGDGEVGHEDDDDGRQDEGDPSLATPQATEDRGLADPVGERGPEGRVIT